MTISDNISLLFKPKMKWKENIIEISIQKSPEIGGLMIRQMGVVEMAWMKLANVNRNLVKVRVDMVRCEAFYGNVVCIKCRRPVNSEKFCTGFCGQNDG